MNSFEKEFPKKQQLKLWTDWLGYPRNISENLLANGHMNDFVMILPLTNPEKE